MTEEIQAASQIVSPADSGSEKEELLSKEHLLELFADEFYQMNTWYDQAMASEKARTPGASGLIPESAAEFLAEFVRYENGIGNIGNISIADGLRLAAEDIKAFYCAAFSAQAGQPTDSICPTAWFWGQTYAAKVIREIIQIGLKGDSKEMQLLSGLLEFPSNHIHNCVD